VIGQEEDGGVAGEASVEIPIHNNNSNSNSSSSSSSSSGASTSQTSERVQSKSRLQEAMQGPDNPINSDEDDGDVQEGTQGKTGIEDGVADAVDVDGAANGRVDVVATLPSDRDNALLSLLLARQETHSRGAAE